MKATWASTVLANQKVKSHQMRIFWRFLRHSLSALAFCGSALFATSAIAQAGLVRWVFDPAIATTAWIAGETISIGYTVTSSGQTDAADLVANLRVKRNDDQAFALAGNYKVCVGFDGICSTAIAQFSVVSGQLVANISNVTVPSTAFREGRQLWVRRLVAADPSVEDTNVRTAYLDIVPTLPNGPDSISGCRLDVDGDGELRVETDGLMIQRYLLGYRGDALVANLALPVAAARKTASSIQLHLERSNYSLNGASAPATDAGLILSRYLAGLRGTALVGVVSGRSASSVVKLIEESINFTNGTDECSLQQLGILSFTVGSIDRSKIPVLVGSTSTVPVSVVARQGFIAADFAFTLESGASVGTMLDASTLRISGSAILPQKSAYVRFRVTHIPTGRYVIRAVRVEAVPITFTSVGSVSAAGGTLTDSLGSTLTISSNSLSSPVTATLREGVHDSTSRIIEIQFSRSVLGLGLAVTFQRPAVNLQPEANFAGNAILKAGVVQVESFDPSTIAVPYSVDGTRLGVRWQEFKAMFVQRLGLKEFIQHRLPDGTAVSCEIACTIDGTRLSVTERTSAELRATVPSATPLLVGAVAGVEYEPVLFVHGFTLDALGGGSGTWGRFPALVRDVDALAGRKFVPFEFRWNTNARFRDVAGDLVEAINLIRARTGKRVHVIAHSFGGLLIRSVIQKRNDDVVAPLTVSLPIGVSTSDALSARTSVASVVTLGSPHSGIADTNGDTIPGTNVALPLGQDAATFNGCEFTSCHEAGEKISQFSPLYLSALQLPSHAGDWVATLADTAGNLPAIPLVVGIGLTSHRFALNDPVLRNSRWDEGDFLISYKGQRFHPTFTAGGAIRGIALRKGSSGVTGQGVLYETILGSRRDVAPSEELDTNERSQTPRQYGYLHSTKTGARNTGPTSDDDGLQFGIEAAPRHTDCATAATCQHAGWLLFKNLQLSRYCEFIEAGCGTPVFDTVATFTAVKDVATTFTVTGQSLAPGYVFAFAGCVGTELSSASTTSRQYRCTPTQAGTLSGSLTFQGTTLKTFNVTVTSPITVKQPSKRVAVGFDHSCAILANRTVKCWGRNDAGQLGDGSTVSKTSPVSVSGITVGSNIAKVVAGVTHTCAMDLTGGVYCWGQNGFGEIGDGTNQRRTAATPVYGISYGARDIAVGAFHSCALMGSGAVQCWGNNDAGQVSSFFGPTSILQPVPAPGVPTDAVAITAGWQHTCVLRAGAGGSVYCWGRSAEGQFGGNVVGGMATVAGGGYMEGGRTCGLNVSGAAYCWGALLTNSGFVSQQSAVAVPNLSSGVEQLGVGSGHNCVRKATGEILCWGSNAYGQLGNANLFTQTTPQLVPFNSFMQPEEVFVGGKHTCIADRGSLFCWGRNEFGQLGLADMLDRYTPYGTPIPNLGVLVSP